MVNEEPYQGLKWQWYRPEREGIRFTLEAVTGAAWLSSARAVRRSLNWGNERNPYRQLQVFDETAQPKVRNENSGFRAGRKEGMTSNQHGPLMPWATLMLQWGRQCDAKPQGGAKRIKRSLSSD